MLSDKLVSWGFTINPYDQCVANKQINGKQCTIVWHVDDLKIVRLNKKFGKESPLTTNRGKILEYLGLTLDYSEKGRVRISMYEYVKKIVDESPDDERNCQDAGKQSPVSY